MSRSSLRAREVKVDAAERKRREGRRSQLAVVIGLLGLVVTAQAGGFFVGLVVGVGLAVATWVVTGLRDR